MAPARRSHKGCLVATHQPDASPIALGIRRPLAGWRQSKATWGGQCQGSARFYARTLQELQHVEAQHSSNGPSAGVRLENSPSPPVPSFVDRHTPCRADCHVLELSL